MERQTGVEARGGWLGVGQEAAAAAVAAAEAVEGEEASLAP